MFEDRNHCFQMYAVKSLLFLFLHPDHLGSPACSIHLHFSRQPPNTITALFFRIFNPSLLFGPPLTAVFPSTFVFVPTGKSLDLIVTILRTFPNVTPIYYHLLIIKLYEDTLKQFFTKQWPKTHLPCLFRLRVCRYLPIIHFAFFIRRRISFLYYIPAVVVIARSAI